MKENISLLNNDEVIYLFNNLYHEDDENDEYEVDETKYGKFLKKDESKKRVNYLCLNNNFIEINYPIFNALNNKLIGFHENIYNKTNNNIGFLIHLLMNL